MKKISYLILGLLISSTASAYWSCASLCLVYNSDRTLYGKKLVVSRGNTLSEAYQYLYDRCKYVSETSNFELKSEPTHACAKD